MQKSTPRFPRSLPTMVGLITALLSATAAAQAPQPAAPAPAPAPAPAGPPTGPPAAAAATPDGAQGPQVKVERGAGGKKIYRITDAIRIEGKIQKPEAFYVLQKSSINYDWLDLKQDFIPKILDSVSRAPF
jgi:hypothetical protein